MQRNEDTMRIIRQCMRKNVWFNNEGEVELFTDRLYAREVENAQRKSNFLRNAKYSGYRAEFCMV